MSAGVSACVSVCLCEPSQCVCDKTVITAGLSSGQKDGEEETELCEGGSVLVRR